MAMQSDAPLLKIRLKILPEVQNLENSTLANEIGREIFGYLEDQGYRIESEDTGQMGGEPVFLIWLYQVAATVGPIAMAAVITEVVNRIFEKIADLAKQIFQKVKTSKHKAQPPVTKEVVNKSTGKITDLVKQILQKVKAGKHKAVPTTIEVQSPSNEINAQGPLADTLETVIPALEKLEKRATHNTSNQKNIEITVTITIKVSRR